MVDRFKDFQVSASLLATVSKSMYKNGRGTDEVIQRLKDI
jgi:hypothetical protein